MGRDPRDDPRAVQAARQVLLEFWTMLGEFRDAMTLVGGSVPPLIARDRGAADDPYIGTTDVDVVVDPLSVPQDVYRSIAEHLRNRGYRQGGQPFQWHRTVALDDGSTVDVEVDILAPLTDRGTKGQRHERVGEVLARRTAGAELLRSSFLEREVSGVLPGGGRTTASVRVARSAAFLVLKAHAMGGRLKEKDAYDIDYLLAHGDEGVDTIVEELRALLDQQVVTRALEILAMKFASVDAVGPVHVAAYRRLTAGADEADQVAAAAYARVRRLLKLLGR